MNTRAFLVILALSLCSPLSTAKEFVSVASNQQLPNQQVGTTGFHEIVLVQRTQEEGVMQHNLEAGDTIGDTASVQDKGDAAADSSAQGATATGSMMGHGRMHGMQGHGGGGMGRHKMMHGGQGGTMQGRGMKHGGGGMHGKHGGKMRDFHQQVLDRLDRIEKRQILIETILRELLLGRQ